MPTFNLGDIILLNRKGKESDLYSAAQRFFTKMPYTHSALGTGPIFEKDGVLTSDECTNIQPIDNYFREDNTDFEIYSVNLPSDIQKKLTTHMYQEYSGKIYGFTQILWFIYRWFMGFFKKDVRKQKNWISTSGVICSELVFKYLLLIAELKPELKVKLDEWRPDNVHVGDIKNIIDLYPDIFTQTFKGNTRQLKNSTKN